jgi:hypothetical protein
MKRLIVLFILVAGVSLLLSYSTVSQAQTAPAGTLPKSAPGLYVSGWPAFTLSYPADWVDLPPTPRQVFRVAAPGASQLPGLTISVFSNLMPLENTTAIMVPVFERIGKDVKVLYKKPSQLKDGTPAFEAELEWVNPSGDKVNTLLFCTAKEDVWVLMTLTDQKGKIGDNLKGIAYSLKMKPGKEEPVKVPDDVRDFLQGYAKAIEEREMEKVMDSFSDRFLQYGTKKQALEPLFQGLFMAISSMEPNVTGFEPQGDKAFLTGFWSGNFGKVSMETSNAYLIKENGKWKWYGNQK